MKEHILNLTRQQKLFIFYLIKDSVLIMAIGLLVFKIVNMSQLLTPMNEYKVDLVITLIAIILLSIDATILNKHLLNSKRSKD